VSSTPILPTITKILLALTLIVALSAAYSAFRLNAELKPRAQRLMRRGDVTAMRCPRVMPGKGIFQTDHVMRGVWVSGEE